MLPFAASNRLELSVFKRGWLPLPVHHAAPPPPAAAAELGWKSPRSNSHGSGTSPPSVPKSSSQLSRSSSQISSCESSLLPESDLGPSLAESEKLSSESLQKPRHAHHSSATTTTARISLASRAAGVLVTTDVRRVDGGIQERSSKCRMQTLTFCKKFFWLGPPHRVCPAAEAPRPDLSRPGLCRCPEKQCSGMSACFCERAPAVDAAGRCRRGAWARVSSQGWQLGKRDGSFVVAGICTPSCCWHPRLECSA